MIDLQPMKGVRVDPEKRTARVQAGVLLGEQTVVSLGPEDAQRLIDDGTARGGMAAKLQAALSALDGGVQRVRISDIAAIADATRGTVLTREGSMCA